MEESITGKALPFEKGLKKAVTFAKQWEHTIPLLIAVDGHSAAGKSTFAKRLAQTLPDSTIIHTDDFYRVMDEAERFALDARGGYDDYYDWQRLRDEVLEPLPKKQKSSYQVYDWSSNSLGAWRSLEPSRVVIVEGCYAARPELKDYYGLIILVETSQEIRAQRQAERADASAAWLARWDAAERFYQTEHKPHLYTDFIIHDSIP